MSDVRFRLYMWGEVIATYTFNEAEVYEDFLEETAHTLVREMGGTVRVCGENLYEGHTWWAFSYIRDGVRIWRFSTMGFREVEWDAWHWDYPEAPTSAHEDRQVHIRTIHYDIPPKSWLMSDGGAARSRHAKSAHKWRKRQAARRARRVGKALTCEELTSI